MRALRTLVTILALLALLALGLLLGLDNSAPVQLAFMQWRSPEAPLFLWVSLALLIGVLIGAGLTSLFGLRHRFARGRAERRLDATQREVRSLRHIALDD
ncbi:MAG TPA: LapA family protein [Pseudomonadales bacterium]|nr:LapA family protein [Pseudomonadales bacterium]